MPIRSRALVRTAVAAALVLVIGGPGVAEARGGPHRPGGPPARPHAPEIIPLPVGFQPEGIARDGTSLLSGSLLDGDIYRADLRTGRGAVLVDAPAGRVAVGLHVDHRHRLFVAGGDATAYVYDTRTGAAIADYRLGDESTSFINDVIVTHEAAWFTDSLRPALFKLPFGRRGALPPSGSAAQELTVTGPAADDIVTGPFSFNFNGIVATPDGRSLIVVNLTTGNLFTISAETGASEKIDLGDVTLVGGDGLVLIGRTLYVVQNERNRIVVVGLDRGFTRGRVAGVIEDDAFRVPTTAVAYGRDLFAVNARFDQATVPGEPIDPPIDYEIVRVRRTALEPYTP